MGKLKFSILAICAFISLSVQTAWAANNNDIALTKEGIRFSGETFLEGSSYRIYCTVYNYSPNDLKGIVKFVDETAGRQIGSDQTATVFGNRTDDLFVDWTPNFEGQHTISVKLDPWNVKGDDPSNNIMQKTINVIKDTDHDKIPDSDDPDDDNDGYNDEIDAFPENASEWLDTDGDRIADNKDPDDDNDGILDKDDKFPLDSFESLDTDSDGIGNNADTDDDNDGLLDTDETLKGTDPLNQDTDGDGVKDGEDAFPLDIKEQYDFDKDGIGDNADPDDDNDGLLDDIDPNDHNKGPIIVIKGNEYTAYLNREIKMDAGKSYDEDGNIKDVLWIIDQKEAKTGNNLIYTFDSLGSHTIKITLTDDKDETREKLINITVYDLDFYLTLGLYTIIIVLAITTVFKYISKAFSKFKY